MKNKTTTDKNAKKTAKPSFNLASLVSEAAKATEKEAPSPKVVTPKKKVTPSRNTLTEYTEDFHPTSIMFRADDNCNTDIISSKISGWKYRPNRCLIVRLALAVAAELDGDDLIAAAKLLPPDGRSKEARK